MSIILLIMLIIVSCKLIAISERNKKLIEATQSMAIEQAKLRQKYLDLQRSYQTQIKVNEGKKDNKCYIEVIS